MKHYMQRDWSMNKSRKGINRKKLADRLEQSIREADDRAMTAQITATLAILLAAMDFIIHLV